MNTYAKPEGGYPGHSAAGGACSLPSLIRRGGSLPCCEAFSERGQNPCPSFLVLAPHLVVRHTRVAQCDFRLVSARLQSDRHNRLRALGCFRHPGVLQQTRPIHLCEAPVMGPNAPFMLHRKIKEPIDDCIQDHAFRSEPRSARTLRINPDVIHFLGGRRNRARNGDVSKLHRDFSFCLAKNSCSRSRRSFQNGSYSRIHRATSRNGSEDKCKVFSRPCRVRRTSPARSSTRTCLQNPVSDIEKGPATSEMRADPRASRSRIARRVGSEIAAVTRSIFPAVRY